MHLQRLLPTFHPGAQNLINKLRLQPPANHLVPVVKVFLCSEVVNSLEYRRTYWSELKGNFDADPSSRRFQRWSFDSQLDTTFRHPEERKPGDVERMRRENCLKQVVETISGLFHLVINYAKFF